jgi:hypothetical protein
LKCTGIVILEEEEKGGKAAEKRTGAGKETDTTRAIKTEPANVAETATESTSGPASHSIMSLS